MGKKLTKMYNLDQISGNSQNDRVTRNNFNLIHRTSEQVSDSPSLNSRPEHLQPPSITEASMRDLRQASS